MYIYRRLKERKVKRKNKHNPNDNYEVFTILLDKYMYR